MSVVALILAGGRGTRLGGVDKAFVQLAGRPLLARAQAWLAPQVAQIAIGANGDPARFAAFALPVLGDAGFAGKGPLAGVAAGLAWAAGLGASAMLSLPVDTPFIPADLVARLAPAPSVAVWNGRQHHLVALWPVDFAPALAVFLSRPGGCKVRDALALTGGRQVDFAGSSDPFLNVNTPEDLAIAEARLSSKLGSRST